MGFWKLTNWKESLLVAGEKCVLWEKEQAQITKGRFAAFMREGESKSASKHSIEEFFEDLGTVVEDTRAEIRTTGDVSPQLEKELLTRLPEVASYGVRAGNFPRK